MLCMGAFLWSRPKDGASGGKTAARLPFYTNARQKGKKCKKGTHCKQARGGALCYNKK